MGVSTDVRGHGYVMVAHLLSLSPFFQRARAWGHSHRHGYGCTSTIRERECRRHGPTKVAEKTPHTQTNSKYGPLYEIGFCLIGICNGCIRWKKGHRLQTTTTQMYLHESQCIFFNDKLFLHWDLCICIWVVDVCNRYVAFLHWAVEDFQQLWWAASCYTKIGIPWSWTVQSLSLINGKRNCLGSVFLGMTIDWSC